jgi:hypothetical protein
MVVQDSVITGSVSGPGAQSITRKNHAVFVCPSYYPYWASTLEEQGPVAVAGSVNVTESHPIWVGNPTRKDYVNTVAPGVTYTYSSYGFPEFDPWWYTPAAPLMWTYRPESPSYWTNSPLWYTDLSVFYDGGGSGILDDDIRFGWYGGLDNSYGAPYDATSETPKGPGTYLGDFWELGGAVPDGLEGEYDHWGGGNSTYSWDGYVPFDPWL